MKQEKKSDLSRKTWEKQGKFALALAEINSGAASFARTDLQYKKAEILILKFWIQYIDVV